ncbi:MAG: UvrD-helicase domain-containing protein [Candidatus Lokiarchaeota archaeon]|nr:UvrD-helicase domain-containing protein [Candidatus Lokiarchaeota archaeon]
MEKFLKNSQESKSDNGKHFFDEKFFKINLNKEQLAIINNLRGPMIVIAGAGSGKTRIITYSVAKLISKGITPSEIMLVTFTNKATDEMLKRVKEILGYTPKGLWGGTFHSLANRFIRMYTIEAGLKPAYSIIDQSDSLSLIKFIRDECYQKKDLNFFPSPKLCFKIYSYAINKNKSITAILNENFSEYAQENNIKILNEILRKYEQRKVSDNFVDFNDLLIIWNKLLDSKDIAQKIAQKIKYVLVDEYQDTNYLQSQIVYKIAQLNNNIMVVGDDAQSIYGFRGADFKNLLGFEKLFPNFRKYKITHNYRSTSEILDLANDSIQNNKIQFSKKMISTRKNQKKPFHITVANDIEQADYIISKIIELKKKGISYSDISILFRSNYHSLTLQKQLQSHKIPFIIRSGLSFFEQSHIKDFLSFSKILQNQHDELAWRRILRIIPGIGKISAEKIINILLLDNTQKKLIFKSQSILQKIKNLKINKKSVGLISNLFNLFKDFNHKTNPIEIFKTTLKFSEYYIVNKSENPKKRITDINFLKEIYRQFKTIKDFLDDMNLNISETQKSSENDEKVKDQIILSTIHRAKGLEWKIVFLISLTEMLFPSSRCINNSSKLEEERRVFYVAVTRAKDELYLISPQDLNIIGKNSNLSISRFITELNDNLYVEITPFKIDNYKKQYSKSLNFITADKLIKDKD